MSTEKEQLFQMNSDGQREDGQDNQLSSNKYIELLVKNAEQGDAEAQYILGSLMINADGDEQSYAEAAKWLRKAAEQGVAGAQYNLGLCYVHGKGVEQSFEDAAVWWHKAAEQGDADAQYGLGIFYDLGHGVEQSDEEAVKWWHKAAEQGHAEAQYNLGVSYSKGKGVEQSDEEAVKWWQKAAVQGHPGAQDKLGGFGGSNSSRLRHDANYFLEYQFIPKLIDDVKKGDQSVEVLADAERLRETVTNLLEEMGGTIYWKGFSVRIYDENVSISSLEQARFIAFTFPAILFPPEAKYGVIDLKTMTYFTFESDSHKNVWAIGSMDLEKHRFMGFYADMFLEDFIKTVHPDIDYRGLGPYEDEENEHLWKDTLGSWLKWLIMAAFIALLQLLKKV